MRIVPVLGFVGWALSMAACTITTTAPDRTPGDPPGKDTPVAPPSPEELACTADADCAVVETKCCDHCNGGVAQAFNVAHAKAHEAKGCEQTMCTERGCGAAVAKCTSGQCTVEIQPIM
jgi:hypothetical protein